MHWRRKRRPRAAFERWAYGDDDKTSATYRDIGSAVRKQAIA